MRVEKIALCSVRVYGPPCENMTKKVVLIYLLNLASPRFSPPCEARASRRRCDGVHGPEGVAGVVVEHYIKTPAGSTRRHSERIGVRSRGVVRNVGWVGEYTSQRYSVGIE